MGQTFNDFKFLYGVIKGITDLDFAFSRLTFTHNCQKNIPIFEDFFGLNSFSELATDEKFKNYKRIEISIPLPRLIGSGLSYSSAAKTNP